MYSMGPPPPVSPVLFAGLAARPLPPRLLQPVLNAVMAALLRRHPGLFERLSCLDAPIYLIDPVDLPLGFVLYAGAEHPTLTAIGPEDGAGDAVATIRGPLLDLIKLLEGRIDGDAIFFSRDLVIEGDTEAVVALRNAVDGLELDLVAELSDALGPLSAPVRHGARLGQGLFARIADDLTIVHRALVAPTQRRIDAQAAKLKALEERLNAASQGASATRRRAVRT